MQKKCHLVFILESAKKTETKNQGDTKTVQVKNYLLKSQIISTHFSIPRLLVLKHKS